MANAKQPNPLDGRILNGTVIGFAGRDAYTTCDSCRLKLTHDDHLYVRAKQNGTEGKWHVAWVHCLSCGPTSNYAEPGYLEVEATLTFRPEFGSDGQLAVSDAHLADPVEHLDWRL
jgi:hypothetical protein